MKSKITIVTLVAVVLFFVLLFVSFEKIGNEESEKNPYHGDLIDFEIDAKAKNIFAA